MRGGGWRVQPGRSLSARRRGSGRSRCDSSRCRFRWRCRFPCVAVRPVAARPVAARPVAAARGRSWPGSGRCRGAPAPGALRRCGFDCFAVPEGARRARSARRPASLVMAPSLGSGHGTGCSQMVPNQPGPPSGSARLDTAPQRVGQKRARPTALSMAKFTRRSFYGLGIASPLSRPGMHQPATLGPRSRAAREFASGQLVRRPLRRVSRR